MRNLILTALLCCTLSPLFAQEFSGGFRAGLNFISFDGDQEMSADGTMTFEDFARTTGFHVGATFALGFTDLFGVKANLMYSQKGGQQDYTDVPSFFYLYSDETDTQGTVSFGVLNGEIDVVNSYIDIPVTAYYRIGAIEIEGGASMGFLVSSRASGGLSYSETVIGRGEDIVFNVDGSYFSDEAGFGGIEARSTTPLPGTTNVFPPSVISTYYNSNSDETLYRRLDFALVGGASFFLNSGLFVGVRYQHGLTDLTKGENDLRLTNEARVEGREFNTDDKDYSRSIQASVGFRF
ncbi:PorT family protein [Neolewinella aurantiaca]|uniref:PorT family protein n=1 Tax=Neolewinella aurantiaca TaxID=2602767 RepID=A0A5C7FRB5_9BACT|nr:outer membrane beta-barrel protein [Neolewinella aurantiaca]TXF90463.1 PorT family protein [Neolewinella aurantiaca]